MLSSSLALCLLLSLSLSLSIRTRVCAGNSAQSASLLISPLTTRSNRHPISLDPAKANEYVRAVEGQRADYRQLLLYGPAVVPYAELHYETLFSVSFLQQPILQVGLPLN